MRKINYIVIHEADCALLKPSGAQFTAVDIDQWHKQRGFQRTAAWRKAFNPKMEAIGYQYVIGVKGDIWTGRAEGETPAAVQGHNSDSINICLIGKGKYTSAQWAALQGLVEQLQGRFPGAEVRGHREFDTAKSQGKTCPDFDVQHWVDGGLEPLPDHTEEI